MIGCPPTEVDGHPVWVPEALVEPATRFQEVLFRAVEEHGTQAMTHIADRLRLDADLADLSRTLFNNTVWTHIEWPRALGSPASGDLSEGFAVQSRFHQLNWKIGPGGVPIDDSRWIDSSPPLLWDGPHDDDMFRVSVMLRGQRPWMNWIGVGLREGVRWQGSEGRSWLTPTRRLLYPTSLAERGGLFELGEAVTTLDDFRVVPW